MIGSLGTRKEETYFGHHQRVFHWYRIFKTFWNSFVCILHWSWMDWIGCSCLLFGTNSNVIINAYNVVQGIQYRLVPFLRAIVIVILASDNFMESKLNILYTCIISMKNPNEYFPHSFGITFIGQQIYQSIHTGEQSL